MKIDRDEFECSDPENFIKEAAPKDLMNLRGGKKELKNLMNL